ncbi:MAG: hypothetical protein GY906_35305 [bacterium]|nr:hypothetical protein [bacterium]
MRLSDIMSAAGLASWAELGLVISFAAFLAIFIYVFVVRSRQSWDEIRQLPLETDTGMVKDNNYETASPTGGER